MNSSAQSKTVSRLSPEELRRRVESLGPWYQNIDLGQGISTRPDSPYGNHPQDRFNYLLPYLPDDLTGKSVLDIGCNAGFFSVEMKRRGAERVLGIDLFEQHLEQARFVADYFGYDIEYRQMDCYDIPKLGETFDVVIFVGVLYHLRHPLLMLDLIYEQCREMMIFQTVTTGPWGVLDIPEDIPLSETTSHPSLFEHPAYPRAYFIEKQAAGDTTNWWFINLNALFAFLRAAGFKSIQETDNQEVFIVYREEGPVGSLPLKDIERRSRHLPPEGPQQNRGLIKRVVSKLSG